MPATPSLHCFGHHLCSQGGDFTRSPALTEVWVLTSRPGCRCGLPRQGSAFADRYQLGSPSPERKRSRLSILSLAVASGEKVPESNEAQVWTATARAAALTGSYILAAGVALLLAPYSTFGLLFSTEYASPGPSVSLYLDD